MNSSMSVIFMCLGIAEIDEQPVTEQLSDMPIVALDNVSTHLLIGTHHITPVFGVELTGEPRGVCEVTEHHRKLAAFSVRRSRANCCGLALRRRDVRRCRWRNGRGGCRYTGRPPSPDQDAPVFVYRHLFRIDEVFFEVFEHVVIQVQPTFQDPIRQTLLPLQEGEYLC